MIGKKLIKTVSMFIFMVSMNFATYVYWEPEIPVPGGNITIYYNNIEGTLPDNAMQVYIHLGYNGWQDTDDFAMTYQPAMGNGWWSYDYTIPVNAETIDFVFTDLQGNWDNNGGIGIDWHISLNYYWQPFNPTPNDDFTVVLNNISQGGYLAWSVDAGNGHVLPIEEYWPSGTYSQDGLAFTPLTQDGPSAYSVLFAAMNSGQQIVRSLKFKILWDDGNWDVGSNGQVMYYDIYFDYDYHTGDPYVFFTSPPEGSQVDGPTDISVVGTAERVEFWINNELVGEDTSSPFSVNWVPDPNIFGDTRISAKAVGADGRITFIFRDVFVLFGIINEPVPAWVDDGVNIDGNEVIITLYAPGKNFVALKGSWNTGYPNGEMMKISGDSLWWYQTTLPAGEYTYQFNVDGERIIADPWSKDVIWVDPGGGWESGNSDDAKTVFSVGADPYEWNDSGFVRPPQNEVIVYEMHIGDFKGVNGVIGTYQDVIQKLEEGYFDDLGINAIELMPVNEFEGENSWGYNPSFYMAPETTYGTPDELRQLIDLAHQRGIAVLMDVVFNHMWGSAPLFLLYQPLGTWDYQDHDYDNDPYFHNQESQWGYKLQHWSYRTRKHIDDTLLMWVNDYHIDGFRFDHTQGIGWDGSDTYGASHYGAMLNQLDPTLIIIAEEDNSYQINNSAFDAGWDYSYYHMMKANLMEIYNSGHNYGDMYDLGNHIVASSQGYWDATGPLVYIESHDESRVIYEAVHYQGMSLQDAYKKSELGATVLFTGQGTPMLYQGQEFGQNGTSRDIYGNIIPQPLQWNNLTTDAGQDLFNVYKKLIALRLNYPPLKWGDIQLKYQSNFNKSIVYWRTHQDDKLVVAANFSPNTKYIDIEFPHSGAWYNYITGDSISIETNWYGGYGIPPFTAIVFVPEVLDFGSDIIQGDANLDGTVDVLDIVLIVFFIMDGNPPTGDQLTASDMTGDGTVDVLDIVIIVDMIMGG